MRTSWVHGTTMACGLTLVLAGLVTGPVAAPETAINVKGTVTDATGAPVPGQIVRLLKTRRMRSLSAPHAVTQEVEEARTKTDEEGRFSLDVRVDNAFPFWFVRFYDPKEFDAVKYRLPQDVEISRGIDSGGPVDVGAVLQMQPDWPKVKALVDQYGPASRRGQILRDLGLPTRQTTEGEEREVWIYDAAGVTYVFHGDVVVETRRTAPAKPAAPAAAEPVPADKVDNP